MIERRELFRLAGAAAAGGSAAALAACGGGGDDDAASGEGDVAVLNALLDLEHLAVAAYGEGARLLGGAARSTGALLRDQEREHADGLAQVIRDLGGRPGRPKPARRYAPMFRGLRTESDVLRFAVDLENTAVAAYLDAVPKLTTPELRGTAAAILTSEAEHLALLRVALGEEPAPSAFVTGEAA